MTTAYTTWLVTSEWEFDIRGLLQICLWHTNCFYCCLPTVNGPQLPRYLNFQDLIRKIEEPFEYGVLCWSTKCASFFCLKFLRRNYYISKTTDSFFQQIQQCSWLFDRRTLKATNVSIARWMVLLSTWEAHVHTLKHSLCLSVSLGEYFSSRQCVISWRPLMCPQEATSSPLEIRFLRLFLVHFEKSRVWKVK